MGFINFLEGKSNMKRKFSIGIWCLVVLAAALFLAPAPASALIITYTDRTSFPDNNSVDWAVLGPSGTIVPSGTSVNAALFGTVVTVAHSAGVDLGRLDQGSGWSGDFAPGDALLWTRNVAGDLILDFSVNIWGGGAQIQRDAFGAFTGTLSAYDSGLNLLGSFSLAGNSTSNADNSAMFMGIFSTDSNIRRLVFSVDSGAEDFAINYFEFLQCPTTPIPIPAAVWLLGSGLLALVGIRRKI